MFVVILFFCEIFDKVHMLAVTNVNGTGGLSAEFMGEMAIKIEFQELNVSMS